MPEVKLSEQVLKDLGLDKIEDGEIVYANARLEKIPDGVRVTGLADVTNESESAYTDTYGEENEEDIVSPDEAREEGTERTEEQEAMPKEKTEEDILGFKRPVKKQESPDISASFYTE